MLHRHQKIFSIEGFKQEYLKDLSPETVNFFLENFDFQKLFHFRVDPPIFQIFLVRFRRFKKTESFNHSVKTP